VGRFESLPVRAEKLTGQTTYRAVPMAFVAKTFCDTFFESLRQRHDTFLDENISPGFWWPSTALIFIALQTCRNEVRLDGRHEEPSVQYEVAPGMVAAYRRDVMLILRSDAQLLIAPGEVTDACNGIRASPG